MSPRSVTTVLLVALAPWASSCSQPVETPWPDGTVLALDETPITADEVDEVAGWISTVDPMATPLHLRRLALTNVVFHRCVARNLGGDARETALKEARRFREALAKTGKPPAASESPSEEEIMGFWQQVGLEAWSAALEAGPEQWSQVVEAPGRFFLVQLVKSSEDGQQLTVRRYEFDYLPPDKVGQLLESALDEAKLTIVDETWREAVPLNWIHRLKVGSS